MDINKMRYIVLLLNPDAQQYLSDGRKIDTNDGAIFINLNDAKEYAESAITDQLCTRYAIGLFVFDQSHRKISISCVETYGFKNDRKNTNQLNLFISKH